MPRIIKPRILLIGVGKFGRNHLRILQNLEKKDVLDLIGMVVATKSSQKKLSKEYKVPVFTKLTTKLIKNADGVDVAAPSKTHYQLVKRCLPYTNVFVEKPLAETYAQCNELSTIARRYKRKLMVGHIYRFNPVINQLKKLVKKQKPVLITGTFLDPEGAGHIKNIPLEWLHCYDIIDALYGMEPLFSYSKRHKDMESVYVKYPRGVNAVFRLGHAERKKIRTLTFTFSDRTLLCDLPSADIIITHHKKKQTFICKKSKYDPLETELRHFVDTILNNKKIFPDLLTVSRIVKQVEDIRPLKRTKKPSVAIIGGGIFGTTCAIELGKFCNVTLFERHSDLMTESSFVNQYRHHKGYHYPRSIETVEECQHATKDFESLYGKSIVQNFPSYYCVAKKGSWTSPKKFVQFCKQNHLNAPHEFPPKGYFNEKKTALCLKTNEGIYHYGRLKTIIQSKLRKNKNIKIQGYVSVVGAKLLDDGKKQLKIKKKNKLKMKKFDYVINATYVNCNKFAHWLGFPIKELRIDLMELLLIRLKIPPVALTMMDGKFATMVTTGDKYLFTLGHVRETFHKTALPKNGIVPKWKQPKSNWKNILRYSKDWYPILKDAEVLESRYVIRGINAHREYDDARPSDIIPHGFGCWSILGGKVVTCVTTAKTIASEVKRELV